MSPSVFKGMIAEDIGVAVGTSMSVIVPRGSAYPCKFTREFVNADNKPIILLAIYQGNSAQVAHNKLIGELDIHMPIEFPKGSALVKVTFDFNDKGEFNLFYGVE